MVKYFILTKSMNYKAKKLKTNSGMTMIELMSVIVIIGILVSIGIANYFVSTKQRALEASLQTNMRTLQVMLETYKVDWSQYPDNLSKLAQEATNKNYNKSIANPYTGKSGIIDSNNIWSIDYLDPTDSAFPANKNKYIGRVGYQAIGTIPIQKYYLLGYDDKSELILRNNSPYLVTSGSEN